MCCRELKLPSARGSGPDIYCRLFVETPPAPFHSTIQGTPFYQHRESLVLCKRQTQTEPWGGTTPSPVKTSASSISMCSSPLCASASLPAAAALGSLPATGQGRHCAPLACLCPGQGTAQSQVRGSCRDPLPLGKYIQAESNFKKPHV